MLGRAEVNGLPISQAGDCACGAPGCPLPFLAVTSPRKTQTFPKYSVGLKATSKQSSDAHGIGCAFALL